jgi:hypothetical protein
MSDDQSPQFPETPYADVFGEGGMFGARIDKVKAEYDWMVRIVTEYGEDVRTSEDVQRTYRWALKQIDDIEWAASRRYFDLLIRFGSAGVSDLLGAEQVYRLDKRIKKREQSHE